MNQRLESLAAVKSTGGASRAVMRSGSAAAVLLFAFILGLPAARVWAQSGDAPTENKTDKTDKTDKTETPMTGEPVEGLESFDRFMVGVLEKHHIRGGALAVARNGKLVLARGYGWADVEDKKPVMPDSLFRIASISKPLTAVTVMRLVEQGKLQLDDRAFDLLPHIRPAPDASVDPRLRTITVRQLLQHTGGWDRGKSFDAMFIPTRAAAALGAPAPADHVTVIRYMMGQPLDFDPGTRYAYSNLGYAILGRIIEHKTGAAYDDAVRKLVLEPAGIKRTILGRTLERFRAKDEVHYYHHTPTEQARSIFSYTPRRVPWPYGGFHLEAMDAHGGWISSPVDLVRFVTALDKSRGKGLVTDDSMKQMLAPPPKPLGRSGRSHYGLGWMVGRDGDDPVYWHTGSLSGTATILVRTGGPTAWAATFNTRPADAAYRADVDDGLHRAAREVKSWPDHDLFPKLP